MSLMDDITKVAKMVAQEAGHFATVAVKQAGELTHANRDKIDDALDKAGKFVDSKTDGKYTQHIDKVKGVAGKGVDFVAQQKSATVPPRPGTPQDTVHTGPNAGWADTSAAPSVGDTDYPNPIPPYTPPTN